nr:hypothetical protein CFP56_75062 [Quercus suber]
MPGLFSDSVDWLMFEFKGSTVAADRGSPKCRFLPLLNHQNDRGEGPQPHKELILLCVCFDLLSLSSLLLQNRFKSPPH